MLTDRNNENGKKMPEAPTGNASNPSPHHENAESSNDGQLIDKRGEKYLRETANIEDVPDAEDQQDMDDTIREANDNS